MKYDKEDNTKTAKKEEMLANLAEHLQTACEKSVDKELLNCNLIHHFWQFFTEVASEDKMRAFLEQDRAPLEGMLHLLQTKMGTDAVLRFIGFFSAKNNRGSC